MSEWKYKVEYKFANSPLKVYLSQEYLKVETDDYVKRTGGYGIKVVYNNGFVGNPQIVTSHDYRFVYSPSGAVQGISLEYFDCLNRYNGAYGQDAVGVIRDNSLTCTESVCQIFILDKLGNILLRDQGKCSLNYSQFVRCGEEYFVCNQATYPGYCCLSCSSINVHLDIMQAKLLKLLNKPISGVPK